MRCLYLAPSGELGVVYDSRLESTSERHKMGLAVEPYDAEGHPLRILERDPTLDGLILEMYLGWVGRDRLLIARSALVRGRRVWLYWPREQAIECVDRERAASHWRHWLFITTYWHGCRLLAALRVR